MQLIVQPTIEMTSEEQIPADCRQP